MLTDEQREETMGSIRADIRQALMNHANAMIGTSLTDTTITLRDLFEQERLVRKGEEIQACSPTQESPWIDPEERMPEYNVDVLVSAASDLEAPQTVKAHLAKTDIVGPWWSESYEAGAEELLSVVAWMPIPEYKS